MNKKEKWGKPKLIILTRGKPEESVLMACKVAGEAAWQDERGGCQGTEAGAVCNLCSEVEDT